MSSAPQSLPRSAEATHWAALVVEDDLEIRQSLHHGLAAAGGHVHGVASTHAAIEALERGAFDVVLLDLLLRTERGLDALTEILRRKPDLGIIVVTELASYETAVEAMKRGAAAYLPRPFTSEQVHLSVQRILEARQLRRRLADLQQQIESSDADAGFEPASPAFQSFLTTARRVAVTDSVVLLRGESGTGKQLLARRIHELSARRGRPFISINSVTGAVDDAVGRLQEAEGGTLFLEEVGELTLDAQARLMLFLSEKTYERADEAHARRADVRILAATSRALEDDVRAGRLREDLWFRLNVITLTLPPLRERREDQLALARHYLAFFARKQGRPGLRLSAAAERVIVQHHWPGNLRELRNTIERAVILSSQLVLAPGDLGLGPPVPGSGPASVCIGAMISLEAVEREHIASVITRAPTLDAAARILGIDATTLQRKRKRYHLT